MRSNKTLKAKKIYKNWNEVHTHNITAQIKLYSMVHGNKNGDAFFTNVPIMFDLRQATAVTPTANKENENKRNFRA